ncbi:MAG: DNA polymerase III subunit delta' [Alphaproteobacteria bacterium]|nr:DNA polymerase III subunit delta' [Alphaproteobacteria bacterium]
MKLLEPHVNPRLLGHEAAVNEFTGAAISERMHHAWLIHGPAGIGKATMAFHIAQYILSGGQQTIGNIDTKSSIYKLVANLSHPDLRLISRPVDERTGDLKSEIPVASIRALGDFFHLTSAFNNWRIAIIADAEYLNRHSANALLKLLEEPPQRSLIIMTATGVGQLLPTIRSRCRKLALDLIDDATMRKLIADTCPEVDADSLGSIVNLAEGSFGRALELIENDGQDLYASLIGILGAAPKVDAGDMHGFADQISRKGEQARFTIMTGFMLNWLQSLVQCAATGRAEDMVGGDAQLLRRYAAWQPLEHWLKVWDKVNAMLATGEAAHLDRKLVLINSLMAITRAAA